MQAAFPDAVVRVAVAVDDNTTVETTGVQSNKTVARTIVKGGGLADNVDMAVWVLTSVFTDAQLATLRGKTATIGMGDSAVTQRILTTKQHALGGLVQLQLGEYDRVTM